MQGCFFVFLARFFSVNHKKNRAPCGLEIKSESKQKYAAFRISVSIAAYYPAVWLSFAFIYGEIIIVYFRFCIDVA